jgi:hypothetical protein
LLVVECWPVVLTLVGGMLAAIGISLVPGGADPGAICSWSWRKNVELAGVCGASAIIAMIPWPDGSGALELRSSP